jgi:hypothetical protein
MPHPTAEIDQTQSPQHLAQRLWLSHSGEIEIARRITNDSVLQCAEQSACRARVVFNTKARAVAAPPKNDTGVNRVPKTTYALKDMFDGSRDRISRS